MKIKKFLQEDKGVIATEYVIFVAAAGIILGVGVTLLFNAMSDVFGTWSNYFGTGS
jgi:Flp pilus assembly pilin Flp